jgi:hypothetical protein
MRKFQLLLGVAMLFLLWECKQEYLPDKYTIYEDEETLKSEVFVEPKIYTPPNHKWDRFRLKSVKEITENQYNGNKSMTPTIYLDFYRYLEGNVAYRKPTTSSLVESFLVGVINPAPNTLYKIYKPKYNPFLLVKDTSKVIWTGYYSIFQEDYFKANYTLDSTAKDNYIKIEEYNKNKGVITGTFNLTYQKTRPERYDAYPNGVLLPEKAYFLKGRFKGYFTKGRGWGM